ncbi:MULTISPECIES: cbb3-type cytochrome oxidase assembly protein CcoS [Echinicola]|uniref:cbb3-type cytochrome oxidase assembly protein CcoS n=1 Tax=Echinicola TaxID=390846 RepID=UPI0016460E12|nr:MULTISPECIES: cbb3-type cytochrome oxidase assembly protein CcoS [Echinicola]
MEVIFILIGVSLVLASSFLFLFFRAMKKGQFDDTYTPSVRILFDSHKNKKTVKPKPSPKTK